MDPNPQKSGKHPHQDASSGRLLTFRPSRLERAMEPLDLRRRLDDIVSSRQNLDHGDRRADLGLSLVPLLG